MFVSKSMLKFCSVHFSAPGITTWPVQFCPVYSELLFYPCAENNVSSVGLECPLILYCQCVDQE